MKKNERWGEFILWMMGPTSSGKTTLAQTYLRYLKENGVPAIHFDGDEIRDLFGDDHGFSSKDRLKVVGTLVYLANKARDSGLNVIVSALTAHDDARLYVKKNAKNLLVLFVDCSIATCSKRDPKGLYKQAKEGKISTLIGFNSPYQPPKNPDIVINTDSYELSACLQKLTESMHYLVYK
jgi:adenylylsulfate kinase